MWSSDRTSRPSSSSARLAAALCVASALLGPEARAADETGDALVQQGLELRRQNRDVEALAVFQRAYGLAPTPRLRAQVALAEQSLGQWIAAEADLHAALDESADPWITRNRATLEGALGFVSTHLGWLTVTSNVRGARVAVNGSSLGSVPMDKPARVAVGTARLRVEADGYATGERLVRIQANDHASEFVLLAPSRDLPPAPTCAPQPSPQAPPAAGPASSDARPVPWAALMVATAGGVGLAFGAGYGVDALTTKAARDQHCGGGHCDTTGLSLDAHARSDAVVSDVAFGIGAAGVLAGGWLYWLARAPAPRSGLTAVPLVGAHDVGVGAAGEW